MSRPWQPRRGQPKKPPQIYLLDQFSSSDLRIWRAAQEKFLIYHWHFYSVLAFQRSKISDDIKKSLLAACCKGYKFSRWQRVVRHKYSVEPLSFDGSQKGPGGRFNFGEDISPSAFPPFPALYIASNQETARQEVLCQKFNRHGYDKALDFALADPTSMANVSVSGRVDNFIDLSKPHMLQSFVDLIKDFKIPKHLEVMARELGLPEIPDVVKTTTKLIEVILYPNWREMPIQFDVPAGCQIFGQLVKDAGIEGVLYRSKFSGDECMVLYPQNFDETNGSLVQLDDPPPKETKILKWDAKSWKAHQG